MYTYDSYVLALLLANHLWILANTMIRGIMTYFCNNVVGGVDEDINNNKCFE
jgi:hypothetical protein